jgi:hypothetical protein
VNTEDTGTVLFVGSHRAGHRLAAALRRNPAYYFTFEKGGKFVVLFGADVDTALEIKSIRRTRLKPDQVSLCWSDTNRERAAADRAAHQKETL